MQPEAGVRAIVDFGPQFGFYVLMLEDPDGIQIELTADYA